MDDLKKIYCNKRVLLTGHTGFKGTWMSVMLKALGAEVCGYSLPLSNYSFYSKVKPNIDKQVEGDIADQENLFATVERFRPEIVFHLASHSSLDGSDKIPDFIFKTNIMGVLNLLESARKINTIKALVIVTSDKCYENRETDVPYTEDAPLGAKDPYSTSKVCQELLTACYQNTFFEQRAKECICTATARASNVIGPGDYNISRLIPYLLDSFLEGYIPVIRNFHAVRPWQNVLDVLYGYLLLGHNLYTASGKTKKFDGAYNFGPEADGFEEVGNIILLFNKYFGTSDFCLDNRNEFIKNETKILKLDSEKAKKTLNWKIQFSLEDTIRMISEFSVREKAGEDAGRLCREYVEQYLNELDNRTYKM